MDKKIIEDFKQGIAEADAEMSNRILANDNLQAMDIITNILEMDEKEFEAQAELMQEILKVGMDRTSLMEKITQMNAAGQTIEDLKRDNDELKALVDFSFEEIGLSSGKAKLLKDLMTNLIELNEALIRYGIRPHVNVYIEKLHNDAIIPTYANHTDAGFDIYALEDTVVFPNTTALVRTGLALAIPEGYEVQIRPRSGWSLKKENLHVFIANAPGTINK